MSIEINGYQITDQTPSILEGFSDECEKAIKKFLSEADTLIDTFRSVEDSMLEHQREDILSVLRSIGELVDECDEESAGVKEYVLKLVPIVQSILRQSINHGKH